MWREHNGQLIDIVPLEECIDCSLTRFERKCHLDFERIQARREDQYNQTYSPSRFNGCDLEFYQKRTYDFWVDPLEQGHKERGTAVHAKLESDDHRIIAEWRVHRVLSGVLTPSGEPVVVSVQPDVIYPALKQISDNKTWQYLNTKGGEPLPQPIKTENRLQLSVGAWAWKDPLFVETRAGVRIDHPAPLEITSGQIMLSDGRSLLRQHGIELVPDETLERWMRLRVRAINRALEGEEPPIPPVFKRWRCDKGCPVRYLCPITKDEVKAKSDWEATRDERRGTSRNTARGGQRVLDSGAGGGVDKSTPSEGPPAKGTRRRRNGRVEAKVTTTTRTH